MSTTQPRGSQIQADTIGRTNLNNDTPTFAVVKKIIAGTGVSIGSTGVDAGTGDVTINSTTVLPDIFASELAPAANETITGGYSAYVTPFYEIVLGNYLEIGLGAAFEIG